MKPADLKHGGVYVVSRDVTNRTPDRRRSRDWTRRPIFPKGMVLVAGLGEDSAMLECPSLYGSILKHEANFDALVEVLEEAPRTLDNVLASIRRTLYVNAAGVLRGLVEGGKVSLDDVEAAAVASADEEDEQS